MMISTIIYSNLIRASTTLKLFSLSAFLLITHCSQLTLLISLTMLSILISSKLKASVLNFSSLNPLAQELETKTILFQVLQGDIIFLLRTFQYLVRGSLDLVCLRCPSETLDYFLLKITSLTSLIQSDIFDSLFNYFRNIVALLNNINYLMSLLEQVKSILELSEGDLKEQVILKKRDSVFFLLLNRKANTFNRQFVRQIHSKLDQVVQNQGPTALVTISIQKIFSAGIDVKFVQKLHPEDWRYFLLQMMSLVGRIVALPVPTICIVKGACYGGGVMLSFAHDFVYAAHNCAFKCPEVDIGMPIPPGLVAVVQRKLDSFIDRRDMILKGKIYKQQECARKGIIDQIFDGQCVLEVFKRAEQLSKFGENKVNFKKLKEESARDIIDKCFNKQIANGVIGQTEAPLKPKL